MHLVTKSTNYPTEDGNLNFIFADNKIWDEYWHYYYLVLPQLMTYVLEICESLFIQASDVHKIELMLNRSIRYAKYAKFSSEMELVKCMIDYPKEFLNIFENNKHSLAMKCENCNQDIELDNEIMDSIINDYFSICPHCKDEFNNCKYYTDLELINKNLNESEA